MGCHKTISQLSTQRGAGWKISRAFMADPYRTDSCGAAIWVWTTFAGIIIHTIGACYERFSRGLLRRNDCSRKKSVLLLETDYKHIRGPATASFLQLCFANTEVHHLRSWRREIEDQGVRHICDQGRRGIGSKLRARTAALQPGTNKPAVQDLRLGFDCAGWLRHSVLVVGHKKHGRHLKHAHENQSRAENILQHLGVLSSDCGMISVIGTMTSEQP